MYDNMNNAFLGIIELLKNNLVLRTISKKHGFGRFVSVLSGLFANIKYIDVPILF